MTYVSNGSSGSEGGYPHPRAWGEVERRPLLAFALVRSRRTRGLGQSGVLTASNSVRHATTGPSSRSCRWPRCRRSFPGSRRVGCRCRHDNSIADPRRRRSRHRPGPALAEGCGHPAVRDERQAGTARRDHGHPRPVLLGRWPTRHEAPAPPWHRRDPRLRCSRRDRGPPGWSGTGLGASGEHRRSRWSCSSACLPSRLVSQE